MSKSEQAAVLKALYLENFYMFAKKAFEVLRGTPFDANWHLEAMAFFLQRSEAGESPRLIINIPPRSLKSTLASVLFPAWLLARDPTLEIMCVSYGMELSKHHANMRRELMASSWYKKTFPKTKISMAKNTEEVVKTTAGGACFAKSIESAITGLGANYLIIDDPLKTGDVPSNAMRQKANDWISETAYTRLNNQNDSRIVIVHQRLHKYDLSGYVQELDDWEVLSIPAIATCEEEYQLYDGQTATRSEGDILDPARADRSALDKLKLAMGSHHFAAQYQQQPVNPEGNLVKAGWLKRYEKRKGQRYEQIVFSADTAESTSEASSYTAILIFGVRGADFFLLDVIRKRMKFPEIIETFVRLYAKWEPEAIIIENASNASSIKEVLLLKAPYPILLVKVDRDKEARFSSITGYIEAGMLHLPTDAPWLADFEDEILSFPDAKNDDQVDALAHFFRWVRIRHAPHNGLNLFPEEFPNDPGSDGGRGPESEGNSGMASTKPAVQDHYAARTGVPVFANMFPNE